MKCLLVLFAVAAVFATGEAKRCYVCKGQPGCNDPFDKSVAIVTTYTHILQPECICSTEVMKYASGITETARSCVIPSTLFRVLSSIATNAQADTSLKSYTLTLCSTDLCNAASSIIATQITLIALAVLLFFTN